MPSRIAQISDFHCGSPFHDRQLLQLAVEEILDLAPDVTGQTPVAGNARSVGASLAPPDW